MINFDVAWWLLVPCIALAVAASLLAYRYSSFRPPQPWRVVLPTLRAVALSICLLLLLRPLWHDRTTRTEPPILAVLADESLSMARHDSILQATLRTVQPSDTDIRLFGFSSELRELSTPDSLRFDGVRTDLAGALAHVREALANEHLRGVLVLSDGQYNTGRNPVYTAGELPYPVYTVAIGDTLKQQDVQVRHITTNDVAYVNTETPIETSIMAHGFQGQAVTVSLGSTGNILETVRHTLPPDDVMLPVRFTYTPSVSGLQQLTVSVTRLDGEATHDNNASTVAINVLDTRKRMLLVGGAPHPDLASIHQFLLQSDDHEVTTLIQKGVQTFYESTIPDALDSFDLIILVGYPGPGVDLGFAQRIATAGTPQLFLLTQNTRIGQLRNVFGESLPVTPAEGRSVMGEAAFTLTTQGRQHTILQNLPSVSLLKLPPLLFNATRWQVNPDARVLAEANVGGVNIGGPLLVVRSREGIRSAALLGAGTWRWANLPRTWPAVINGGPHSSTT